MPPSLDMPSERRADLQPAAADRGVPVTVRRRRREARSVVRRQGEGRLVAGGRVGRERRRDPFRQPVRPELMLPAEPFSRPIVIVSVTVPPSSMPRLVAAGLSVKSAGAAAAGSSRKRDRRSRSTCRIGVLPRDDLEPAIVAVGVSRRTAGRGRRHPERHEQSTLRSPARRYRRRAALTKAQAGRGGVRWRSSDPRLRGSRRRRKRASGA